MRERGLFLKVLKRIQILQEKMLFIHVNFFFLTSKNKYKKPKSKK